MWGEVAQRYLSSNSKFRIRKWKKKVKNLVIFQIFDKSSCLPCTQTVPFHRISIFLEISFSVDLLTVIILLIHTYYASDRFFFFNLLRFFNLVIWFFRVEMLLFLNGLIMNILYGINNILSILRWIFLLSYIFLTVLLFPVSYIETRSMGYV